MADSKIYEDIALRTGGDIYVGVVGPVRTGKSTFIKRFMETAVIPNIDNVYVKERARDELPQSGSGRTVMTAEPKFVPEEAVHLRMGASEMNVRLIDCVGYMVDGAVGITEEGEPRMVTTPWFDHEIDISAAAEEGTHRVICDHSTVGLVITTDGSICGIPRESYVPSEERVVRELCSYGKPFIILLNCQDPFSLASRQLAAELTEKYGVKCRCISCMQLTQNEINEIIRELLCEFPTEEYSVYLPEWVDALPSQHPIKADLMEALYLNSKNITRLRNAEDLAMALSNEDEGIETVVSEIKMGTGSFDLRISLPRELYYQTLSEESGLEISCDGDLIRQLCELSIAKKEYEKVRDALMEAREKGYGVVYPSRDEMTLREPEIVKQGGKYSVVLHADAPAIHMIKTNIEAEVTPAVGGSGASDEILGFLLQNFDGDASKIWDSNIFGRSLYDIAGDSLMSKIGSLPINARRRLHKALQKISNDGCNGLICIIY